MLKNSPAENAGLRKGDIIVSIESHAIGDLKDLSAVLKRLSPGDAITIVYYRGEMKNKTIAQVIEK